MTVSLINLLLSKIKETHLRFITAPEYDGYDDVYGHSVDDDNVCISPTDASQWIFDRERGQQSMSEFLATHRDIQEEDEDEENDGGAAAGGAAAKQRRDSESFQMGRDSESFQQRKIEVMHG